MPKPHPFAIALDDISIDVRAGEIVAIAGVAGNGQDELYDAVSGETRADRADAIRIDGVDCGRRGDQFPPPAEGGLRAGGAARPWRRSPLPPVEQRRPHPARDRRWAGPLGRASPCPAAREITERVTKLFDVRKGSPDPEAAALSGGNLQKFVVGREFDRNPGVLVVCQPTWGVDAGAAATIRQALIDLARAGSAVLVISQDLDEILEISDRVVGDLEGAAIGAARHPRRDARGYRPAHGRRRRGARACALS